MVKFRTLKSGSLILAGVIASILGFKQVVQSQDGSTEAGSGAAILKMFDKQPDFMADMTIVMAGGVTKLKIANKEGKFLQEVSLLSKATSTADYKITTLIYPERPWLVLDHQEKTYSELPNEYRFEAPNPQQIFELIKQVDQKKASFTLVGTESIDGHLANKISLRVIRERGGLYIYVAKDLKNLIVKLESFFDTLKDAKETQTTHTHENISYELSNISLNVPDELFQVPQGYGKVDIGSFNSNVEQKVKM